jgi:hypothetical protein
VHHHQFISWDERIRRRGVEVTCVVDAFASSIDALCVFLHNWHSIQYCTISQILDTWDLTSSLYCNAAITTYFHRTIFLENLWGYRAFYFQNIKFLKIIFSFLYIMLLLLQYALPKFFIFTNIRMLVVFSYFLKII